jgi:tetratricopeptide (TPR) repeat protein
MGIFDLFTRKDVIIDPLESETEILAQSLLKYCQTGNEQEIIKILENTVIPIESRLKLLSFCQSLGPRGFNTAQHAYYRALIQSTFFWNKKAEVTDNIKMSLIKRESEKIPIVTKRIAETKPSQVFITGPGIHPTENFEKQMRSDLGSEYNIQILNTDKSSLILHELITSRREILSNPDKKNIIVGIYPRVSWFPFLQLPPHSFDIFSPWTTNKGQVAVFLLDAVSLDYLIEVAQLVNVNGKAPGFFENIVDRNDRRITTEDSRTLTEHSTIDENRDFLLNISEGLLRDRVSASQNIVYSGNVEQLKHESFAEVYIGQGKYLNAISELDKAISFGKKSKISLDNYYLNQAFCYAQLGKFENIEKPLKNALKIDPRNEPSASALIERIRRMV